MHSVPGVLLGVHEDWPLEKCLLTGTCAATACMSDPTCTDGLRSLETAWPWPMSSGLAKMKANFSGPLLFKNK
jgi:hypothetical protein